MTQGDKIGLWQRWLRQPQRVFLRRAIFQVHLWTAIGSGLYIIFISITGSVLVYRNELYEAAIPDPIISTSSDPQLSDDALSEAATRLYPGYTVASMLRPSVPDAAVEIWLVQGDETERRLFDPRTGADMGRPAVTGIALVEGLIEIHADLLAGRMGRFVNGIAALVVTLVVLTGLVIWWPGVARWRRSLTLHKGVGWKRFNWDLHSASGIWGFVFILMFAFSGLYLCVPDTIHALADLIQVPTDENAGRRFVDDFLYWLAYLHFGRINGIGIPCSGPGLCDQTTKAVWALLGLIPAAMFVTGTIMWWNRVLRPWWRRAASRSAS